MIPPRIGVKAGLHIAEGHNQSNQHSWVYQAINQSAKPTQSEDQPLHTRSKTIHSQLCEEDKDTQVTIPNKRWNTVQVQPHSRVVLGPSVAKKTQQQSPKDVFWLNNQEATQNQGESTAQTHNENYGNLTQSQNRGEEKLPA